MNVESVAEKIYANQGNRQVLQAVPSGAATVLDVGCGAGDNARLLSARGVTVDGITVSPAEAEAASRYCRRVMIHNLEQGLPAGLDAHYDACICSHVLEHICWPGPVLNDVREKLTANAPFIVALPNIMMWKYRLALTLGRFEYTDTGVMDRTHFRWYTRASAQRLFVAHGFATRDFCSESFFPMWKLRQMLPKSVVAFADSIVGAIAPSVFGLQMVFTLYRDGEKPEEPRAGQGYDTRAKSSVQA